MNWKAILQSIAIAAAGGAISGGAAALSTSSTNWSAVKGAAASGALVAVAALIKQNPFSLPPQPTVQPTVQEPK